MKAYVVLKKGFEYNDEIYSESEGGHPKRIFFDEKIATEEANRLNIIEFKSIDINHYSYDIDDIVKDVDSLSKLVKDLNTKYGIPVPKNKWDNPGEYSLNEKANDQESLQYSSLVNLSFYSVIETDIDDQELIRTFRESKLSDLIK